MVQKLVRLPSVTFVAIGLSVIIMLLLSIVAVVRAPGPDRAAEAQRARLDAAVSFDPEQPYSGIPTPDPTPVDWVGTGEELTLHVVAAGETLGSIATQYGRTIDQLVASNGLIDPNVLEVGQELIIPADGGEIALTPSYKIIPDSELLYSPGAADFSVTNFVRRQGGYLARHTESVEGVSLTGAEIVQLVADRMLVNPRLLLAALEHRAGWVTSDDIGDVRYPLRMATAGREGLYRQLEWAANQMNRGYYGRLDAGVTGFTLADGTPLVFAPDINPGTIGVQVWLGADISATYTEWLLDVSDLGFAATYEALFGNPFRLTYEPIVPAELTQPSLSLPWREGEIWYYTGGPHGAWASGSAWAALDFAPPSNLSGCYETDLPLIAVADGIIIRSSFGGVVLDLDGDGFVGTGWAIHYLHVDSRNRVDAGRRVKQGDPIGHPGCEGGVSNGTHLHIARSYNGRWISADGALPFDMGGWVSGGFGNEYDGTLTRDNERKEACVCREPINAIGYDP